MDTQESVIDYSIEASKLSDREEANWWKVDQGQHKLHILDNGNEFDGTDYNNNPVKKIHYKIGIADKVFDWSVTKSKTKTGLFGQITLLAVENKNTTKDLKFTLVVKGDGKGRQYTILEALELLTKKKVEESKNVPPALFVSGDDLLKEIDAPGIMDELKEIGGMK